MVSENYHITPKEEVGFKKAFDTSITPDLWVARYGHRVLSGDLRNCTFPDKDFERWIHEVYELLHSNKRSELMKKLLDAREIAKIESEGNELNF